MNKVAKLIEERKEDLARVISLETGKNYNESVAEVNESLHMAQFAFGSGRYSHGEAIASEIEDKDCYMLRKPKGVIAIVTPFNFPLAIGMFWNAAPALVEGNTIVIKPSEDAPMSTQMAVQIYADAGIPRGVINLVHGDGGWVGEARSRRRCMPNLSIAAILCPPPPCPPYSHSHWVPSDARLWVEHDGEYCFI